jgi:site-specific DNA-methyltransferase (adenine-specific)
MIIESTKPDLTTDAPLLGMQCYAQVFLGDCLIKLKDIKSESIDLLLTDPPYKIITGGDSNGKNSIRPKGILSGNRELMKSIPNFEDWLSECFRVLKNGTHAYIMVNSTNLLEMANKIEKAGFKIHNFLIWKKNNCTPSQFYMKNCEYVIFFRKGKAKYINRMGDSKTVHEFNNIIGNKVHPTEKPIGLMQYYILNSTNENDLVLDPFMGSGSTGVACKNINRNFIGIEKDEAYFKIAEQRINARTLFS